MKPVMVVGGGITGIQAALDVADQGIPVYLVEKSPTIGGRMAQLDKTFPTLDCSSCILTPKMASVARHPNIELITYAEVKRIEGGVGNFKVKVVKKPRYIDVSKCTGCGVCVEKCPQKAPDYFNLNMNLTKAIYIPFPQAVPLKAVINPDYCLYFTKKVCRVCERFCPAKAIDFEQKEEEVELEVASIIIATGYHQENPGRNVLYGYGVYANVYTGLEFERLLSSTGPTKGEIVRRSDGRHPKRIAFIQCVCSREEFNRYCSSVCCMQSTKEAILAKEHLHDVDCTIFYMDIRAFGKGYEEFYRRAQEEFGIRYVRSKPAKIREHPDTKNLTIIYEDTTSTRYIKEEFDMVVLAVALKSNPIWDFVEIDDYGFALLKEPYRDPVTTSKPGIFVAGVVTGPKDIPDSVTQASAAAMRASIIALGGGGR